MIGELLKIAGQCDGVRCDMAMLVLPEVFERTWGAPAGAVLAEGDGRVRERVPGFCFMAEVYWDLEWTMLQQGFDYAYDKRLYDRLREGHARPVREHFTPGSTTRTSSPGSWKTTTSPGPRRASRPARTRRRPSSRFSRRGCDSSIRASSRGGGSASRRTWCARRWSPPIRRGTVLRRAPAVLRQPTVRDGQWRLLECVPAWEGNWTSECFIAWAWEGRDSRRLIAVVNYAGNQSQCYVRLPFPDLAGRAVRLKDLMGPASYDREGSDLLSGGLYLDLPPWGYHVFEMTTL